MITAYRRISTAKLTPIYQSRFVIVMSLGEHSCGVIFALLTIFMSPIPATSSVEGPTKPRIFVPPSDTFSAEGVLEFVCQAEGVPKPVIHWYDATNQQQVVDRVPTSGSTSGIHVNQHYGRLMVSNPTKNMIYTFYCNASNSVGWTVSHPPVKGGLAYLESKFVQLPTDQIVHEGDNVVLECRPPKGVPQPKVVWLKQDKVIATQELANATTQNGQSQAQVTQHGSLKLYAVGRAQTGIYTCVASNIAGRVQSPTVRLTVEPRVQFIETPKDTRVRQGMSVKFKCLTEGNHMVQWSKDYGKGMIDPTRVELAEGYLLLKNVQLSDSGTYVCSAPGSVTTSAVLTVETPPAFSRTPDDLTVREGETATFECITTGYPKPSIYWELADKTPIFPTESGTAMHSPIRFYVHKNGRLDIRNVQLSDAGKYQCTAHSSVDRIHSTATLHVIPGATERTNRPISGKYEPAVRGWSPSHYLLVPVISLPPVNQTRTVGELATLDCELGVSRTSAGLNTQGTLEYYPLSTTSDWTVSWARATVGTGGVAEDLDFSGYADEHRFNLLPGGSLQIVDIIEEDSGFYTCTAKALVRGHEFEVAQIIQSNWTAHLKVVPRGTPIPSDDSQENPLSPPRNLQVTNRTDTTLTLAWDPVSADESNQLHDPHRRIAYWVQFYRADQPYSGWMTVEKNWMANVVKIGGLLPNTAYYFLIRPRWSYGRVGWASAPLGPIGTLPEAQSFHHQVIDAQLLSAIRSMQIQRVQLYALTPRRLRVSWEVKEKTAVLALITGYTVYYKKASLLACVANDLDLVQSSSVSVETADVYCSLQRRPGYAPDELYSRFQELQRLRQLKSKDSAQSVETLNVDARLHESFQQLRLDISDPAVYEGTGLLRDLDPFTCYEISVKAHLTDTVLGKIEGRASKANSVLTFETFPSHPPEQISAKWVATDSVELNWVAPPATNWNGLLTGYAVYVYDELAHSHQAFNVSYMEIKTRIGGLTSPNAYFIQMAGMTCKGVGIRSKPLRLDPRLKTIGLGSGWGYDDTNGQSLSMVHQKQNNGQHFAVQPWFIVTMIISLLLWGALMGLIAFCCKRQRYVLRKAAGSVMLTNGPHCGSVLGDSGTISANTSGLTEPMRSTGRYKRQRDHLQVESLLQPSSTHGEAVITTNQGIGVNIIRSDPFSSAPDQSAYCTYSVSSGVEFSPNQWPTRNGESQVSRTFHPENISPAVYTMNGSLNANSQRLRSTMAGFPHVIVTHPLGIHSSTAVPMYTPSYCTQSPNAYLTYQPQVVSLSQSIMEFSNPTSVGERPGGFCSVAKLGVVGASCLPPISPVAQLGSPQGPVIDQQHPSFVVQNTGHTVSVTPYATASIIKSSVHSNQLPRVRGEQGWEEGQFHPFGPIPVSSCPNEHRSEQSSFSSGDSCITDVPSNRVGMLQLEVTRNRVFSERANSTHAQMANTSPQISFVMEFPNEHIIRSLTPARPAYVASTKDTEGTPSTQSKSESTASTSTRPSDEKPREWRNTSPDSVNNASSSVRQVTVVESGNQNHELLVDSVYSFADDHAIPPPPASPPPPAPCRLMNGFYNSKESFNYHFSEKGFHCNTQKNALPVTEPNTQQTHAINGYSHAVYDLNAESSDDEHGSIGADRLQPPHSTHANFPRSELSHHDDYTKRQVLRPNCEPIMHQFRKEEATNSTYAQVY
ncbi:unnamed protein product [Dicrocoelium dendriticum]|nr:unnamed protein product [Dicrocoelium dendriticum]